MTDDLKIQIDKFIGYFRASAVNISHLSVGDPKIAVDVFRGTLFATWLDAISRSTFPNKKPRDRFLSYVTSFCDWPDQERVSLTHVQRLLALTKEPDFTDIRFSIEKQLIECVKDGTGSFPISFDPAFNELCKNWPTENGKRKLINDIDIKKLRHSELLYSFRNGLVHEFRILGYGFDFADDQPYYHVSGLTGDPKTTIELVYPLNFLQKLCSDSLSKLESHLLSNNINPFEAYKFGTYWLEDLN